MLIWYPKPLELEIIKAYGRGLNNSQIAESLNISVVSVESRLRYLKERSGIKSKPELLVSMLRRGDILLKEL